jgi:hypothetical protein
VEELEKLRNEFLGMVSHELRTPLSTIKGAAATALRSRVPLSPGENLQFFRIVEDQVDRLTDLVNDLLDMSRIEAGTFAVSTEPTELSSVLEEAIVDFGNTYKHHQVQLQIPEGLPAVEADRRRIVQVLTNLLNNAATVSPITVPITLELEYDEGYVTVHVRDCGRGISQEKQLYLFKKFAQVDESKGGGNSWIGLSLAICKGIVEAHGGRIWANDSREGNGTTISFTLPKAAKATVPSLVGSLPGALQAAGNGNQSEHFRILIELMMTRTPCRSSGGCWMGPGIDPSLLMTPGKSWNLLSWSAQTWSCLISCFLALLAWTCCRVSGDSPMCPSSFSRPAMPEMI